MYELFTQKPAFALLSGYTWAKKMVVELRPDYVPTPYDLQMILQQLPFRPQFFVFAAPVQDKKLVRPYLFTFRQLKDVDKQRLFGMTEVIGQELIPGQMWKYELTTDIPRVNFHDQFVVPFARKVFDYTGEIDKPVVTHPIPEDVALIPPTKLTRPEKALV